MTHQTPDRLRLVLTDQGDIGTITVDMESFFEFTFDLAEQLKDLEREMTDWQRSTRRRGQGRHAW